MIFAGNLTVLQLHWKRLHPDWIRSRKNAPTVRTSRSKKSMFILIRLFLIVQTTKSVGIDLLVSLEKLF